MEQHWVVSLVLMRLPGSGWLLVFVLLNTRLVFLNTNYCEPDCAQAQYQNLAGMRCGGSIEHACGYSCCWP